ncbi:MAG: RNA polymerase sigma factor [Acidimicrobiia bacterium]
MSSEVERRDRFEAIAAEVYDPLQRYLRRRATADESDDLFADVLLTVWRRLDDVPQDAVLPWCYGVARRTLSNHRRTAKRHLKLVERLETEREPAPGDGSGDSLQDPDLAQALAVLPVADQEILRLWAWEQLEPREIAQVLGSTANAVSLRLSRARKKLAASLTRQDPSNPGHIGDRTTEEHQR